MTEQLRSGKDGTTASDRNEASHHEGVGGRHRSTPSPGWGGGYLDICTTPESPLRGCGDPRLAELAHIGLHSRWLRIAAVVGYEKFVEIWQILDESLDEDARSGFTIHKLRELHRYQRNRYIERLADTHTAEEIRQAVRRELGEDLSKRQIARLMR